MPDNDQPDARSDEWIIHLKPIGDGPPGAVRVRHLLKRALRDWGLKCVLVRNPTPADVPTPAPTEEPGQ